MNGYLDFQDTVGRKASSSIQVFDPAGDYQAAETRLAIFAALVNTQINPAIYQTAVQKQEAVALPATVGKPVNAPLAIITDRAICTFSYIDVDTVKTISLQIPAPDMAKFDHSAHLGIIMKPAEMQVLADGLNALLARTDITPIRGTIRTKPRKARG
jgi:hypothetical protein